MFSFFLRQCWNIFIRNSKSRSAFCDVFLSDDSWGGGIELAILTQEYEIEICVINTESGGRIDYFGEDRHFPYRVFLLYNNLHYDPGS